MSSLSDILTAGAQVQAQVQAQVNDALMTQTNTADLTTETDDELSTIQNKLTCFTNLTSPLGLMEKQLAGEAVQEERRRRRGQQT